MTAMKNEDPMQAVERLPARTNAHDVEGIVACFAPDYSLESPLHPARSFRGTEQVRRNWTQMFAGIPDVKAKVVASAHDGNKVWTEWEMGGTRRDGAVHLMRGIFVFAMENGLIRSGRMFLEPVDASTADMDAAIRATVGGSRR
jgi:ketosteroid isomerase-like protein